MKVAIYTNRVLNLSETFILNQMRHLENVTGTLVGLSLIDGMDLSGINASALLPESGGKIRELIFRFRGNLPQKADAERFDLVHAHFGTCAVCILPYLERTKIPLVVTFHGKDVSILEGGYRSARSVTDFLLVMRKNWLKRYAQKFICVSRAIEARVLALGFPKEKVVCHYIGIDSEDLSYRIEDRKKNEILCVGRLCEKKGVDVLLRAYAKVKEKYPSTKLLIAGDGPLREELKNLNEELGCAADFVGAIPFHKVKQLMGSATLLAVPSVTAKCGDTEGLPTTIMEANALGLPVVSTHHSGIPEIIEHEVTGLLSGENDVEGLVANIKKMLKSNETRLRYASKARAKVESDFDLKRQTALLEQIYYDASNT